MDNDKKPEYLKKILKEEGQKAANEDPAKDQKKILAPIKDETTILSESKKKSERIERARKEGGAFGRGIGGDTSKTPEGEHKSSVQKILNKGEQKAGGLIDTQAKNNKKNVVESGKREKRMLIPEREFDPKLHEKVMDQRDQNLKDRMEENKKPNTEKAKTHQKQISQEPQSKHQPTPDQKKAQNAQQEQIKKSIISKIAEEVKNADFKKVTKVAGPLISRLGGKYGATVVAGVGLAAELIEENRNAKEQKPTKEGKGNEKITSLRSIASPSKPNAVDKKPEQQVSKKVEKGSSKLINSLRHESSVKKTPTPAKKPSTPGR